MIFIWYYIFNIDDFEATGLTSKTYNLVLENIGQKAILVTKGNLLGITYDGIFLALNMHDQNPFIFEEMAIYSDENNNVFLGFLKNED